GAPRRRDDHQGEAARAPGLVSVRGGACRRARARPGRTGRPRGIPLSSGGEAGCGMTSSVPASLLGAPAALRDRVRQERAKLLRRTYPASDLRDDPIGFSHDVLSFAPWDRQAVWMRSLVPESAAVSIASGHKTGKSSGAAAVCLWFWGTRRRA